MRTNVPKLRPKIRRDRLKFEKWMGITKDDAETKSIRKTRVRYSDLESETKDPYIRFWVILLEIESMKKFILQYKRYSQKCPRQLLRSMQQFVLGDTWISSVAKTEWSLKNSWIYYYHVYAQNPSRQFRSKMDYDQKR